MSTTHVLVAITEIDLQVETITKAVLEGVARRPDMKLLARKAVPAAKVTETMAGAPSNEPLVLLMVSQADRMDDLAERWLAERANLLVAHIGVVERTVRIAFRGPGIDKDYLVAVLRELLERAAAEGERRTARATLRAVEPEPDVEPPPPDMPDAVIDACVAWLRKLLGDAATRVPEGNGWAATRASVLHWLEPPAGGDAPERSPELVAAEAAFANALTAADPAAHPLAAAHRRLGLGELELRMLALGLASELDPGFQRGIGFLLDDFGRRVGTLAMYCWLLGESAHVRMTVARSGALARWLVFDAVAGDEPLRLDPFLARWLLGDGQALEADPRVRRVLRTLEWEGASLLDGRDEEERASDLVDRLRDHTAKPWIVLHGDDPTAWRALIEVGATVRRARPIRPIRIDAQHLAAIPLTEVEDCARRIGRMALLTGAPVVIDAGGASASDAGDALARLFATLAELGCRAAVLCDDQASIVRLLGRTPFELVPGPALTRAALAAAVRKAAAEAEAHVTEERAGEIATCYPLGVDALEHAMRLARARPLEHHLDEPRQARFTSACKEVAAEGASHLADRIEPLFSLEDVVLPSDRREQLVEIVDNVRLASQVLDGWHFREQLPYGRGVTALFAGPPGTGKTMAAIGIARRLGVQILRLDLSRVVSKYIGDTEKHLDCLFRDGHRSGSAIVVDEAEALMGKRSEVKDAHDRYANIEVAYLLQRMEAYEGLVILTTNMQQSFDPAFLRRLRFVVDFPRPDADGRERIWRQCLPQGSHDLDDQTFRQLGRRIDVTGGHIRQITLRAAFVAAAAGLRIGRAHVAHAVRAELIKLGMPAVEIDPVRSREAA